MENYLLRYRKTLFLLGIGSILAILAYLCLFMNMNYAAYFLSLRVPKVLVMVIVAFAIGGASIVFQSIIQNTIVTPCLLGMNSLYSLIHTGVVFFLGSGSVLIANANVSFAIDVVLMGIIATVIYSYLFRKTKHNVLYVLLTGTILTTLFTSIQTTLKELWILMNTIVYWQVLSQVLITSIRILFCFLSY